MFSEFIESYWGSEFSFSLSLLDENPIRGNNLTRNAPPFDSDSVFLLFWIPIFAQTEEQILRSITGGTETADQSSSFKDDKKLAVLRAKNRLLGKSIDTLSDREVDDLLLSLGLTRDGSLFNKRKRLRAALEETVPVSADPISSLPKTKKGSSDFDRKRIGRRTSSSG